MQRSARVQVMQQTLQACQEGAYTSASGKRVFLDQEFVAQQAAQGRLWQSDELPQRGRVKRETDALADVHQGDCLLHALALQEEGYSVCCLNMASHKRPGGGYLSGAGAQEENLFRRTNYFQFVENDSPLRPCEIRYPLPEFGGVYSPNVYVIRGTEHEGYPFLEEPRLMSFIAVAAYARPPVYTTSGGETRLQNSVAAKTKLKMRLILDIGLEHGHDAIVLSALGCGAFQNPAPHIAELFHEVIYGDGYRRYYRRISFAIIDDRNAVRSANREGNVAPFQRIFQ